MDIADAIIERPQPFEVDGVRYFLYPPTLGKTIILERHLAALGFDMEEVQADPYKAALRAAVEQKEAVATILSIHTCKTKDEVFDAELIGKRTEVLKNVEDEDLATLLVLVISRNSPAPFFQHLKINEDRSNMEKVRKAKDQKGKTYTFGGHSMYGTLIDHACERYGWSMEYVVWGISYLNLQMLMADSVQTMYLTEEEAKNCHITIAADNEDFFNADDADNVAMLYEILNQ